MEESMPGEKKNIRRVTIKRAKIDPEEIKKGQLLSVKAPPYYNKEYIYEVTRAGDKLVSASLYHSPTVRKSWKQEEFLLLIEMGIIRLVGPEELQKSQPAAGPDDRAEH